MAADCYREQEEAEDRLKDALSHLKPYEAMKVLFLTPGTPPMAYRIDGDGLLERITLVDPGELARRIEAAGKVERSAEKPVIVPAEPYGATVETAEYPRIDFGMSPTVAGPVGRTLRSVSRTLASSTVGPLGHHAAMGDDADTEAASN